MASKNHIKHSKKSNKQTVSVFSRYMQIIIAICLLAFLLVIFLLAKHTEQNLQRAKVAKLDTFAEAAGMQSIFEQSPSPVKTVFVIVMENQNWANIKGSSSAAYINKVLLPQSSYATAYYTPEGIHPSEPNYIWMEAGDNFGITRDDPPVDNPLAVTDHLVTQLDTHGILWKSYQEDISGTDCPLQDNGLYAVRHNPMVFFDDVTENENPQSVNCIIHVRPYKQFAQDLQNNTIGRYNFITPNLCDDMHNTAGCKSSDQIKNGDTWFAANVPQILHSQAYKNGGAIFITWDEGKNDSDGPIGMIVLSPLAKGNGYVSTLHYTHSSLLKTIQEIFHVSPFLGDAAHANDLRDLFVSLPVSPTPSTALAQVQTTSVIPPETPTSSPTSLSLLPNTPAPLLELAITPSQPSLKEYSPGSTIDDTGFSFTYPANWRVFYKIGDGSGFVPLAFTLTKENEEANLSIDVYPKTGSIKEFLVKNFPAFADKLSISPFGKIGNEVLYQVKPRDDIAANDLTNFEFGIHGIIMGGKHIYDIGFTGGSRQMIDTIEKTIWSTFRFE